MHTPVNGYQKVFFIHIGVPADVRPYSLLSGQAATSSRQKSAMSETARAQTR